MPKVNGKEFPYTKAGKKNAKRARRQGTSDGHMMRRKDMMMK